MADIDKALPNVKQTVTLPSPKDVEMQQQQVSQKALEPVDIQRNEDGSADITFDPRMVNPGDDKGHFSNLAELLPDDIIDPLGNKLYGDYMDY